MSETESCSSATEHKAHMCQLKADGKMEEIDRHEAQPNFVCNRCGAHAEEEGFLCQPRSNK